jgi:hypothetical protein
VNFADAADEDRLNEIYPAPTRARLAQVKARYDPGNVFHHNLNVPPAQG